MKVIKVKAVPTGSISAADLSPVDYFDVYGVKAVFADPIEEIARNFFTMPVWVLWLLRLRNLLVKPFGLAAEIPKTDANGARTGAVGNGELVFPIIARNEKELVTGFNDKHLEFRFSLLAEKANGVLYAITLVKFNNAFGRVYFTLIKPFHKIIIKSFLRRYSKKGDRSGISDGNG